MNNNKFTEVVLGLLDECKELLVKKGEDYSTEGDRLDNFKSAEQFTSLTQWQCWEALFFKHIQAIRSYFKSGRKALNEDIHHRIRDAINYLILLEAMLIEEKESHAQEAALRVEDQESEALDEGFKPNIYICQSEKEFKYIHNNIATFSSNNPQYTHYSWGAYTYIIPLSSRYRDHRVGTTPRV